jgi:lysozyme C
MKFFATLLIFAIATQIDSKIYTKCEFAKTMRNAGFSMESLPDWVCLAQHESNFNSNAINYVNSDGSWDWGKKPLNLKEYLRKKNLKIR